MKNEYARTPRRSFLDQRAQAERRGIPFRLTFEEWWSVWAPHWTQRKERCLQMCREGDEGAYELGNVRIDTAINNFREHQAITAAARDRARAAAVRSLPDIMERVERTLLVKAITAENGHKTNAARRLGITFRQFRYLAKRHGI